MTGLDRSGAVAGISAARRAAARAAELKVSESSETPPETPANEPGPKTRAPRRTRPGERWEDRNVRRTFHLPVALIDDVEAVTKALDVSLSAAVREALSAWVDERRPTTADTTTEGEP